MRECSLRSRPQAAARDINSQIVTCTPIYTLGVSGYFFFFQEEAAAPAIFIFHSIKITSFTRETCLLPNQSEHRARN